MRIFVSLARYIALKHPKKSVHGRRALGTKRNLRRRTKINGKTVLRRKYRYGNDRALFLFPANVPVAINARAISPPFEEFKGKKRFTLVQKCEKNPNAMQFPRKLFFFFGKKKKQIDAHRLQKVQ